MPEIRIKISPTLDDIINKLTKDLGIQKTEYAKNCIINDLKERGIDE